MIIIFTTYFCDCIQYKSFSVQFYLLTLTVTLIVLLIFFKINEQIEKTNYQVP